MTKNTTNLLWASLLSVLLAACGTARPDLTADDGSADTDTSGIECTTNEECGDGYVCQGNTCAEEEAPAGCGSSEDCPVGLLCELGSGECVECLSDDQCGYGDSCIDGACSEGSTTTGGGDSSDTGNPDVGGGGSTGNCSSDNDCSYGRCDVASGYCVDCLSDTDCPGNYVCQDMICIDAASAGGGSDTGGLPGGGLDDILGGGGDTPCTTQADCDASCTVCNPATSMCEACSDTLACGEGLTCADPGAAIGFSIGNLCITDPNDLTSAAGCFGGGGLPGFP